MSFRPAKLRSLNEEKKQMWRVTFMWLVLLLKHHIWDFGQDPRSQRKHLIYERSKIFVTLSTADTQQLFRDCRHVFSLGLRSPSCFPVSIFSKYFLFLLHRNALELHAVFWTLLLAALIIFSRSCSDCPVIRALNEAPNALANNLHNTAKLPPPSCSWSVITDTETDRKRNEDRLGWL